MATWGAQHRRFENLMRYRIRDILLVSSPYDYFTLEEDGRLNELLLVDYQQLNLSYAPRITHAATGERALDLLKERPFDLVITMARVGEMAVHVFGRRAKEIQPGIPVVLLAYNTRELALFHEGDAIDRIFVWSGDARVLLAIVKLVEDLRNVDHDTKAGEVQVLILVEDSPRFYSLFLPQLYSELMKQTGSLMAGGLSLHHKLLRMRARAKILLATDMEQAQELYGRYAPFLLGVISDAGFPSEGSHDPQAGKKFITQVQRESPDAAVMLQSSLPENRKVAAKLGVEFIDKADQSLLKGLRSFMRQSLGFGDFIFRLPDGKEVGRAQDLVEMRKLLPDVPGESLRYHALRHGFSKWFRARTEFDLATSLRPHVVTEFTDNEELRQFLLDALRAFEKQRRQAEVADYSSQALEAGSDFVRLGGGSLGGKGRSLAYFHALLPTLDLEEFGDIEVCIPRTAVVGTKVFDEFLESNELGELAYSDTSELEDDALAEAFLEARFPESIYDDLKTFVEQVEYPLAVRSSSLLEDSQHQPFAGVYETYMLSNNHPDPKQRLQHLCDAIKLVYASTFYRASKAYIAATPNRIEEEKMGVVIQEMAGLPHGDAFYPTFAGVARSRNFYPLGYAAPEDGVVAVALGLGLQGAVFGEHGLPRLGHHRAAAARAPAGAVHQRLAEHGVQHLHQLPGALVAHAHLAPGRRDRAAARDTFEKVEGGRELGVLDLAHMAAAHIGPMSKLLLAEAAGASQFLDVQCYTVPQVHARETGTMREISPRDICYIRRRREEMFERREIAEMGCLPIRRSRDDPSRKHSGPFNRSFGKGRHRHYRCR